MDFIMGLPKIKNKTDSIFVVVDKLSKEAHFIPLKSTYKEIHIADIFLKDIFILHGIPRQSSPIVTQILLVTFLFLYSSIYRHS